MFNKINSWSRTIYLQPLGKVVVLSSVKNGIRVIVAHWSMRIRAISSESASTAPIKASEHTRRHHTPRDSHSRETSRAQSEIAHAYKCYVRLKWAIGAGGEESPSLQHCFVPRSMSTAPQRYPRYLRGARRSPEYLLRAALTSE